MANINLEKYFKKSTDIISSVDSKIIIDKKQTDVEFYGDLKLDLQFNEIKEKALNAKESNKDLQKIVNEESVITALKNIFNTRSCSRLLNPEMNIGLEEYLFEPINPIKGWFLGYNIMMTLPRYEPRVKIDNIEIVSHVNEGYYSIKLSISIPNLSDTKVNVSSIFSSDGFQIIK